MSIGFEPSVAGNIIAGPLGTNLESVSSDSMVTLPSGTMLAPYFGFDNDIGFLQCNEFNRAFIQKLLDGKIDQTVVIQRRHSIGDVLAASCVTTSLKEKFSDLKIVFTANRGSCSEILRYHPDIDKIIYPGTQTPDLILDGAYEGSPDFHSAHIYHFFLRAAGLNDFSNIMPRVVFTPQEIMQARRALEAYPRPWILCGLRSAHAPERSVPDSIWRQFVRRMREQGETGTIFACGGPQENSISGMVNFVNRFSIRIFAAIMSLSDLVVTSESGPLHLAMAVRRPVVVVGMATDPDLRALPQIDYTTVTRGIECQYCSASCRLNKTRPPCGRINSTDLTEAVLDKLNAYRGHKISALIPVYRPDLKRIERCIDAVKNQVDEIIIGFDDAAAYSPPELPPGCRAISSKTRLGFSRMMNLLARQSKGRYLLLLNDDLYLSKHSVRYMEEAMDERTAVVGGCWRYPDRTIQHGGVYWRSEFEAFDHIDRGKNRGTINRRTEMECVTFACALVRREAFFEIQGFDERYTMYWEDMDFCHKVRSAGWKVIYEPRATGVHEESQSSALVGRSVSTGDWEAGKRLFLKKWKEI